MNRLVQGDVGSGKTLVAVMAMLFAIDNGYQTTMMVPTEILAEQHFINISQMLKDLDVQIYLNLFLLFLLLVFELQEFLLNHQLK